MKATLFSAIFLLFCCQTALAQTSVKEGDERLSNLEGTWIIDLRPSAEDEAYLKEFVIESIEGKTFSGEFYGSRFEGGLINSNWDRLYFAFTTEDESNVYHHSGYVLDGMVHGLTHCPNRDFVAPWTGQMGE